MTNLNNTQTVKAEVIVFRSNNGIGLDCETRNEINARIMNGSADDVKHVAVFYADTYSEAYKIADEFIKKQK
jgi:hypothetical protein